MKPKNPKNPKVPVWEWVVAGIGLVLIVSVLGALIWDGLVNSRTSVQIELRVQKTVQRGPGELVMVEVQNHGGEVAADLKVRGSLFRGETEVESREITIDYVPRHSRKTVGLFFSRPTATHELRLTPIGFVEP